MSHFVLTDGQGDTSSTVAFLEHQRRHPCTDCGHTYLTAGMFSEGVHFSRAVIGGGTVVVSKHGPINEVHIVPHGGTELPRSLLDELDSTQLGAVSTLVHENADTGTGAIYRQLVQDVVAGKSTGVAVAGFHLSRILLDANREKLPEQLPLRPYVGSADIYSRYLKRHGEELRMQELLPWIAAVNDILRETNNGVVYHHHTYDVTSFSPRPWDRGADSKRPPFQLVWEKPALLEQCSAHEESALGVGLAPLDQIECVQENISDFMRFEIGLTESKGSIDFPLTLPLVPFWGARRQDPPDSPRHVVYDLRKDILITEEHIQSWVARAPWRLDLPRKHVLDVGRKRTDEEVLNYRGSLFS